MSGVTVLITGGTPTTRELVLDALHKRELELPDDIEFSTVDIYGGDIGIIVSNHLGEHTELFNRESNFVEEITFKEIDLPKDNYHEHKKSLRFLNKSRVKRKR